MQTEEYPRYPDSTARRQLPPLLAGLFILVFIALGVAPLERSTWLLENIPTVLGFTALVFSVRVLPLSNTSYVLLFVFLCLHVVGSHYTYSLVPYEAWSQALFGVSPGEAFGWERNHYDRFLHFLFGLLLAYPLRELFFLVAHARGFWSYYLPLNLIMASSLLYELIEWGAAVVFGGDLAAAYLGAQGDSWDAQWDMALASLGGLIAIVFIAVLNGCGRFRDGVNRRGSDAATIR